MRARLAVTPLGSTGEIGASAHHLDLGDTGLLLDAGLHPKRAGEASLPAFAASPGPIEAIVVSHAHLDHVGALPVALQRHPAARLYMTGPTALLAARMLRNAVAVSRNRERGSASPTAPLYSNDHVEWIEDIARTPELDRPFFLDVARGERPGVTLLGAGHLLGAAGVLVEHRGRRFFYTGDTCASGQHICGPARYPRGPIDLLLLECTHGADPEPDLARDRRTFGRAVAELGAFIASVVARGGSVLLPVFAQGRAQEILGVLHHLARRGRIPPLPVYISGLAHAVCRIYDATRRDAERRRPELRLEDAGYQVLEPERVLDPGLLEQSAIFAATSGMMYPGTSSNLLARRMLPDPRHGVGFVGFLDPESPGARVAAASRAAEVGLELLPDDGQRYPVRCAVRRFPFTAHSRASQLVELVRAVQPRRVLLVHGETASAEALQRRLTAAGAEVQIGEAGCAVPF